MDSFYEHPRMTPKLSPQLQNFIAPAVPEVSLMFNDPPSKVPKEIPPSKPLQSYNAWKLCNNQTNNENDSLVLNRNSPMNSPVNFYASRKSEDEIKNSFLKKQVRFEHNSPISSKTQSVNDKTKIPALLTEKYPIEVFKSPKTFERIYMGDKLNKKPDLSAANQYCRNTDKYASEDSILNWIKSKNAADSYKRDVDLPRRITADKTASSPEVNNESPTIKDLMEIIKLQNEQLQLLQTQVQTLMQINKESPRNASGKQREKPVLCRDQQVGTSFDASGEDPGVFKGGKISVGLMTSFEVSVEPATAHKKKQRSAVPVEQAQGTEVSVLGGFQDRRCRRDHRKAKPTRINETDYSLCLNEPLHIQEAPLSPNNSIHIDMQEYDSESDDEYSPDDEAGWTFYNDILGQVNNILKNCPPSQDGNSGQRMQRRDAKGNAEITDRTIYKIKQATLQCLQRDCPAGSNVDPSDVSFAVQQLLMKYLSDEELASVLTHHERRADPQKCNAFVPKQHVRSRQTMKRGDARRVEGKILDITALKQQPKLT